MQQASLVSTRDTSSKNSRDEITLITTRYKGTLSICKGFLFLSKVVVKTQVLALTIASTFKCQRKYFHWHLKVLAFFGALFYLWFNI